MNGWQQIHFSRLVFLLHDLPPHLRWKWRRLREKRRTRLQLVSQRGTVWDFRLCSGAWIRRAKRIEHGTESKG